MPQIDVDPVADGATVQWAPVPAPPNWECVLDAARPPDNPELSIYVETDGSDNLVDDYQMHTVADVDELTSVTVHVYCQCPLDFLDQNIHVHLFLDSAWLELADLDPPAAWTWCHTTANGSWTQADLDALQVRVTAHDPDGGAEIKIAALHCHVTYTEPEPPPPPPEKERAPLRPPGMRSPPKITTSILISRISGPFRSSHGRFRFNTRKGRRINISRRKPATPVASYSAMHLYSSYCWHLVDTAWKFLDKRRRIEWGKCTYRTANKARSNIDEFRRHNMPRVFMGWPMLATPPNRFKSRIIHLPTGKDDSADCDNANIIIPIEGETKDHTPFNTHVGDLHIPPLPMSPCCPRRCMEVFSHCYWGCVASDFPIRGNKQPWIQLRWECQRLLWPYGHDPDTCEPYLKWVHLGPWVDVCHIVREYPDEDPPRTVTIGQQEILCVEKYFMGHKIPSYPGFAFVLLRGDYPIGFLGQAYYSKPNLDGCPQGEYTLFHTAGHKYKWPRHMTIAPYGNTLEPCVECPKPDDLCRPPEFLICYFPDHGQSGQKMHTYNRASWTRWGYNTWRVHRYPEFGYVTMLECHTSGPSLGHWTLGVSYAEGVHATYVQTAKCQARVPTGAWYLDHPDDHMDMPNFLLLQATDQEGAHFAHPEPPRGWRFYVYLTMAWLVGMLTVAQVAHMQSGGPTRVVPGLAPELRRILQDIWNLIGSRMQAVPCGPVQVHISAPEAERLHDILTQAIKDGKFPGLGGF